MTRADEDLFFALKGGMNRFGAVTSIELLTHEQSPQVWVSLHLWPATSLTLLTQA